MFHTMYNLTSPLMHIKAEHDRNNLPKVTLGELVEKGDFDGAWNSMESLGEGGMLTAWDCGIMLKACYTTEQAERLLKEIIPKYKVEDSPNILHLTSYIVYVNPQKIPAIDA